MTGTSATINKEKKDKKVRELIKRVITNKKRD